MKKAFNKYPGKTKNKNFPSETKIYFITTTALPIINVIVQNRYIYKYYTTDSTGVVCETRFLIELL